MKPSLFNLKYLILAFCLIFCIDLKADEWTIVSETVENPATVTLANGELGVTTSDAVFGIERILKRSSYFRATPQNVSRIAEVINPLGLIMRINGSESSAHILSRELDLKKAVFRTHFTTPELKGKYEIRSLRQLPNIVMMDVGITADEDIELEFENIHEIPTEYSDTTQIWKTIWCEDGGMNILQSSGSFNKGKDEISASSLFIYEEKGFQEEPGKLKISLRKGEKAEFSLLGCIITSERVTDVWNESDREVIYGKRLGKAKLIEGHEQEWDNLWNSDIEIDGDPELQQIVRVALFNLYSSIRPDSSGSIPPMGLTATDYNGHIFWDAEMWIFPALIVMHPELAKQMLEYRVAGLEKAKQRASFYGFKGAMFPWESDDIWEESTPTFALTGPLEHHITADIAIAAWNYYLLTKDEEWLINKGYPLIKECADFWVSRVEKNEDESYSIPNVVGADEYTIGVDDNAFTNGSVKIALSCATEAALRSGTVPNPIWEKISKGLKLDFLQNGVTAEHSSYKGEIIKQADVNLLGYPLGISSDEQKLRDMEYYIDKIDKEKGPAMSHSVFSIQYSDLGKFDKAIEMFKKSYEPYIRGPFFNFSETATSDNPYFMTGAGGMLQAIIYGFAGYKITPEGLQRENIALPSDFVKINVKISPDIISR